MKNSMMLNLFKYTLLIALTIVLLMWNPFNFEGAGGALYAIIPLGIWLFFIKKSSYSKSELSEKEKDFINKEKIKSFFRSAIQVIGALIAAAAIFKFEIPYIGIVTDLLEYLSLQVDVAVDAILTIVGIVMYIIGYFKDSDRFESRALVSPRKINLDES